MGGPSQSILVTGATGFVGRALRPALRAEGYHVRATTRDLKRAPRAGLQEEWVQCELLRPPELARALSGMDAAFYLVHSMGHGQRDYRDRERSAAMVFAEAAGKAGLKRILYLGGVAPSGAPSEHLASRLAVGEILRSGPVPTLELRASMIIGHGSASWKIVRDLALRLPAMILPRWTSSRTRPVAIEDVVVALVRGLRVPLPESAWFDLPGPETLRGREILMRIAALRGRRIPALRVPVLSPSISSWWLRLITGADFSLARELVLGLSTDLLPRDERYWELIDYRPRYGFDEAARRALASEAPEGLLGSVTEHLVDRFGPRLRA